MLKSPRIPNLMPWEFFIQEFRAKYVIEMYRETKWKQFLTLKQRNLSMTEYEEEFNHLSKYTPESVLNEAFWCNQFEDGLNESIKGYLAHVTSLQHVNFYQLVQVVMKVERFEASNKKRFQKYTFSRGASSSSGKRIRESQAKSNYSSTTRGRRQGPSIEPSTIRGASVGPGETLESPHCHQ